MAMTRQAFGAAPCVGDGVVFLLPNVCAAGAGRVSAVPTARDRGLTAQYYRDRGKANVADYTHVFERDTIVVRLPGNLRFDVAARYEAAPAGL